MELSKSELVSIALLVIGCIAIGSRLYVIWYTRRMLQDGVAIDGHIRGRDRKDNFTRGGRWKYWLYYDYEYEGQWYSASSVVPRDYYESCDIGTTVPVCCPPGNPTRALLEVTISEAQNWLWTLLTIILGAGMIVAGICGLLLPA